ncbi:MAG: permease-like cell division protein FtsX [Oscillospiraceae bacterium]
MSMNKWNAGYYVREGFSSILTHGLMSFAAVCMIVACLLIMGSFTLVAVNVDFNLGRLEDENEFLAYVDETLTEPQIAALGETLKNVPNVSSSTFISREQAAENYVKDKDPNLYADLPPDTFRHRYSIHVVDIEKMEQTVKTVENIAGIGGISADVQLANGFVAARNVASGISFVLIATLVVISLFIITNTIKLATFTRREEIAIMKMCGATNGFVRWPFVVEGMVLGLMGAVIAFFLQWGIYGLIGNAITSSGGGIFAQAGDTALLTLISFKTMIAPVLGIFCGTGFVIGVGGSLLAIRKFLQV